MFYSSALQPSSENKALYHNPCKTTVAANVLWNKLNDKYLRAFLEEHYILEDPTIWKMYLDESALEEIQENLEDTLILGMVDKITAGKAE